MSSTMDGGKTAQRVVIQTIFVVQICLVLVIFSLIGLGYWLENGLLVRPQDQRTTAPGIFREGRE